LHRRLGLPSAQAAALGNLSSLNLELGRPDHAVDLARQAVDLYRAAGDAIGEANALTVLGEGEHAAGEVADARRHLEQALGRHRELGNRLNEAWAMMRLAAVRHETGDGAGAHRIALSAHLAARNLGYRRGEVETLNALAAIHAGHGRDATAAGLYRRALRLSGLDDSRYAHVQSLLGLAASLRHYRHHEALDLARRAQTVAGQAGYRLLADQAAAELAVLRAEETGAAEITRSPGRP
jgi:tetratricopeptide (TPR) repeat protein